MKKQSFIIGAIILAIGGFLAKAIGAFYKIPLTNILGSNGMGIYYLVFPLYSMILVICSSGISVALSRLVAGARVTKNKRQEKMYLITALMLTFVLSILFTIILMVCARPIAFAQGNVNAYLGYISIAPAVLCASLVSVVKGYFQGIENMIPSSVSMIIEQVVKLAVGLVLSTRFLQLGVEYAVFGAILGVTLSELLALLIIFVNYIVYKRRGEYKFFANKKRVKNKIKFKQTSTIAHLCTFKMYHQAFTSLSTKEKRKLKLYKIYTPKGDIESITYKQAFRRLIRIAFPCTLSNLVMPIASFVDSFLVINLLVSSGKTTAVATSLYGINNGAVNSLISLPIIITTAISTVIVPNLSGIKHEERAQELGVRSSFFIKLTFILSIPMFVLFVMLAPEIISALYSKGLVGKVINEFDFAYKLLLMGSVSILYNSLLQTLVSILQCIGKAIVPFYAMIASIIVRTILLISLIQVSNINIFAVVIANSVFLALTCLVCVTTIRKYIILNFGLFRLIIYPIFAGIISAVVVYVFKQILFELVGIWATIVISGLMCVLTYCLLIFVFKCFNHRETKFFPNIKRILRKEKLIK